MNNFFHKLEELEYFIKNNRIFALEIYNQYNKKIKQEHPESRLATKTLQEPINKINVLSNTLMEIISELRNTEKQQ